MGKQSLLPTASATTWWEVNSTKHGAFVRLKKKHENIRSFNEGF
jgi:hypothetical protein